MPNISVIVPVYKVEAYLPRCVDSILRQSYADFELILVDDGSPDGCPRICDEYARQDSRVRVIHQENGGLSAARNAGLDWAAANSGSWWITFVDSDDWVHRDYLLRLISLAEETGCQLSACRFFRTGGEDFPGEQAAQSQCLLAEDYFCGSSEVPQIAWAKLYRRSLFDTLRFPVGKLHEDEFTTYQAIFAAGKVCVTSDVLYAYYQNPAGIMQTAWKPQRLDALEAFEQQLAFAETNGCSAMLSEVDRRYLYCILEQLQQVQSLPEASRRYATELRRKLRDALCLGRRCGNFPLNGETAWLYRRAYMPEPVRRAARAVKRMLRRTPEGEEEWTV